MARNFYKNKTMFAINFDHVPPYPLNWLQKLIQSPCFKLRAPFKQ